MSEDSSKNQFSNTVILPKTDFPMKADLAKRELPTIDKWKKQKLFTKMREVRKDAPKFVLHDGPPYANGNFHVGHALNKILKDIIVKFNHLNGFYSDIIPGWDCHGLPIEVQVLKELGKNASTTSPSQLRKKCRDYAQEFVVKQGQDLGRFLCLWDEDRIYLTMSKDYEARIVEVFGDLYKAGYIYKGKKPVYWCIALGTAHAEAEIEYQTHKSPSIYVKFPADVEGESDLSCLIWTTTPWTLPANLAICFNETFQYAIYKTEKHGRLILAEGLKESVEQKTGITLTYERSVTNKQLSATRFMHPFINRESVPLFGGHVTLEAGTGCVHTAPGHGMDDYKIGVEAGLDILSPVDDQGRYTDEFPLMKGMKVFDANPEIIKLLIEKNALLHQSEIEHSYPHSWRSKKPLIFRATPQWFFSIDYNELRERSLKAIDKVQWIPEWGINRIRSMVESRPDWCLSRQRNWGVPIPAFQCKECGMTQLNSQMIDFFVDLVKREGIEVWYDWSPEKLLPPNTKCDNCNSSHLVPENDILDVWFDSGVSNFAVLDKPNNSNPPADLYLEGSDQHRGWFQSSLWPSIALRNIPPYRSVLTHGYVLDDKGHAMSKSLGNVINPADIIKENGADVLRLWVSSQDFRDDVKIGKESIKVNSEQYRKIRNTFRYLLGNLDGHSEKDNLAKEEMHEIDRYYLSKLAALASELQSAYQKYNFHHIYQKVIYFCTVDLSQEYFEIIRDRMYCDGRASKTRRSSCTALSIILETLAIYLAPILSFTMEEVWESYGKKESIFLSRIPDVSKYLDKALEEKYSYIFQAKESIQKAMELARQNGAIGKSLDAVLYIEGDAAPFQKFSPEELEFVYVVSQVEFGSVANPSATVEYEKLKFHIAKPASPRCPRCWRYTRDIHTEGHLCERCKTVLS